MKNYLDKVKEFESKIKRDKEKFISDEEKRISDYKEKKEQELQKLPLSLQDDFLILEKKINNQEKNRILEDDKIFEKEIDAINKIDYKIIDTVAEKIFKKIISL